MKKFLSTLAVAGVATLALASCQNGGTEEPKATETYLTAEQKATVAETYAGEYDLSIWVSESTGVTDLTAQQIRRFETEFPGIKVKETLNGVTEANAATQVIADVASAPDLYCFAQDQLVRLVQVGALSEVPSGVVSRLKGNNDKFSIASSTVASKLYCYPLTSDNGYFMYYDKSVITDDIVGDFDAILAKCENDGKMFAMEGENAWYNASFFFGAGCHSTWTTDETGAFTSIDDDYNSAKGIVAMNALKKLLKSPAYVGSSSADQFKAATPAAVVISGTWASKGVKEALGDKYAAAPLPSFKGSDGKSYHMGSFYGNKLIGVKPQDDAKKAAVAHLLAEYLTLSTAQLERFDLAGWGPSNLVAQQNEKVKADVALLALKAQADYAVLQGQIGGSWWDTAAALGTAAKAANTDADLQAALDTYDEAINNYLHPSQENKLALTVIGAFNEASWNTDITVVKGDATTGDLTDGTYYSSEKLTFAEGAEFKIRQGFAWDTSWGDAAADLDCALLIRGSADGNCKVGTAGQYYVGVDVVDNAVTRIFLVTELPAA
ncbi:MAG: extracellular solute-binding protein [Acholeplasmatales bacterium]|nr:extracellular solute-binding protein [Acholeplasmatales bacterium]